MADVNQDTLRLAGVGDMGNSSLLGLQSRQAENVKRSGELAGRQEDIARQSEELIRKRSEATAAPREALAARAKDTPSVQVKEEKIPDYTRPTMKPEDLNEAAGILLATSMLVGAASRTPYNGMMAAMSGAMTGFAKADETLVRESLATFDKNLTSVKEKNAQKRRELDDAWKKYKNDLVGLKTELELIAAKYDDPMAQLAARSKSLTEAQKVLEANVRAADTAIVRLEGVSANAESARARLEEARARREEAAERAETARADRERHAAERGSRSRFKDEQALKTDYDKQTKDLRGSLSKVDNILYYADRPAAFSDVQLRQAVSEFQKGARGTNAMIASMVNFGTLDERIAGRLNRFFEGDYSPEQRGEIKQLFLSLRDSVLRPNLETERARYKWLATENGFNPEHVVLPEKAGEPPAAPGAAPGASAEKDFDASFNTKLTPDEESKFQEWKSQYAANDSGDDYDLRGAFKAGLKPGADGHWPDTFKKPNHPTFSNESRYAKYGTPGHWEGQTFVPARGAAADGGMTITPRQ